MNTILYKITNGKPGFWLMIDVPECAKDFYGDSWQYQIDEYKLNLERCKDNALEIINPELLHNCYSHVSRFEIPPDAKDGDTFDLEGLEFEQERECKNDCLDCMNECNGRKVIRLIQKTETQDELIGEIWRRYFPEANISQNKVDDIKSKFTIKRNP